MRRTSTRQVVGHLQVSAGFHAVLWENGTTTDLGTLGGNNSFAGSISPTGQVVGSSETAQGDTHAYLWDDGVMTDLGTLGGPNSFGGAINPGGQMVGSSQTTAGELHAVLWDHGDIVDLGTLPGGTFSSARAINPQGQIAGEGDAPEEDRTPAILWTRH